MSYAVRRPADAARHGGQASGGGAPTTATVLDYACLFTHDLRRKQKRWQDGKLKFHTFNKRVMVYDDRGNFIGDAHWHSSDGMDPGEELELDRGSAIVQVADCTGSREQDLSDLLGRRAKDVEQRRAAAAARAAPAQQRTPAARRVGQPLLLHRPLSALVPSPGPIGRAAISGLSPFEARRAEAQPAAKRRKLSASPPSKRGFAQNLFGARLTLSSAPAPTPPTAVRVPRQKPGAGVDALAGNGHVRDNDDDDEVVMLDGSQDENTRPAQLNAGHAKAMAAHVAQNRSWKPPRASASAETGKRCPSRQPLPAGHSSSPILEDAQPTAETRHERKKPGHRLPAPKSQSERLRQPASRSLVEDDAGQLTGQRRAQKPPRDVPLPQSKDATGKAGEMPSSSLVEARPCALNRAEPRTELRIKPKRRRGLLMMTEQIQRPRDVQVVRPSAPAVYESGPEASPPRRARDAGGWIEAPEQSAAHSDAESVVSRRAASTMSDNDSESDVAPARARPKRRVASVSADRSSDGEGLPPRQRRRGGAKYVQESDDGSDCVDARLRTRRAESRRVSSTSESESDGMPELPRKSTRRRKQPAKQAAEKSMPPRPRITKMARKSVRSKEIFGFVPPAGHDMVPALFAAAASRAAFGAGAVLGVGSAGASAESAFATTQGAQTLARPRDDEPRLALESDCDGPGGGTDADAGDAAAATMSPVSFPEKSPGASMEGDGPPQKPLGASMVEGGPPEKPSGSSMAVDEPPEEPLASAQAVGLPDKLASAGPMEAACGNDDAAQPSKTDQDAVDERRPRLQNPATRGKKAAQKGDAACHPLQNPVPMDPPTAARVSNRTMAKVDEDSPMLPGFRRANGGAWSKHAEDLLGMTRPAGRTRGA